MDGNAFSSGPRTRREGAWTSAMNVPLIVMIIGLGRVKTRKWGKCKSRIRPEGVNVAYDNGAMAAVATMRSSNV
jgi:hypothetical protein